VCSDIRFCCALLTPRISLKPPISTYQQKLGGFCTFDDINLSICGPIRSQHPIYTPSVQPFLLAAMIQLTSRPRSANSTRHMRNVTNKQAMRPRLLASYPHALPASPGECKSGDIVNAQVGSAVQVIGERVASLEG
jgi:hypothetical protein